MAALLVELPDGGRSRRPGHGPGLRGRAMIPSGRRRQPNRPITTPSERSDEAARAETPRRRCRLHAAMARQAPTTLCDSAGWARRRSTSGQPGGSRPSPGQRSTPSTRRATACVAAAASDRARRGARPRPRPRSRPLAQGAVGTWIMARSAQARRRRGASALADRLRHLTGGRRAGQDAAVGGEQGHAGVRTPAPSAGSPVDLRSAARKRSSAVPVPSAPGTPIDPLAVPASVEASNCGTWCGDVVRRDRTRPRPIILPLRSTRRRWSTELSTGIRGPPGDGRLPAVGSAAQAARGEPVATAAPLC